MDATLQAAHSQLGVQSADVLAALRRTPLHPAVRQAIQALAQAACEAMIVSDANTVYIDTILRHHGLQVGPVGQWTAAPPAAVGQAEPLATTTHSSTEALASLREGP